MSRDSRLVWSDTQGDIRKKESQSSEQAAVVDQDLLLLLRRLTSGKGRSVVEIRGLPDNKNWCKKLAKELKKALAVGGAFKNDFIEIHSSDIDKVISFIESKGLKFKKVGG